MGRGTITKQQRGVDCVHSENEFLGAFADASSNRLPFRVRRSHALFDRASPSPRSGAVQRDIESRTTTPEAFFASGRKNLIAPILFHFIFGINFDVLNHSCRQARR